MTKMKVLVGADPELFVTQDGKFRSAHGLIPGTKENPHPVNKGAVQVDGLALEFNIDPAANEDEFVDNIVTVMAQLKAMVPQHEFAIVPAARFNGNHFRIQPEEAKELGCTPDYDAYTMEENPRPNNKTTLRTTSGHVHIGFRSTEDPNSLGHMLACSVLMKQLDASLGLFSLIWDKDKVRRSMYGQAGAFRPKPYGGEYRVLSNAWLTDERLMRFVYRVTQEAIAALLRGERWFNMIPLHCTKPYINGTLPMYKGTFTHNAEGEVWHAPFHGMPSAWKKLAHEAETIVAEINKEKDAQK